MSTLRFWDEYNPAMTKRSVIAAAVLLVASSVTPFAQQPTGGPRGRVMKLTAEDYAEITQLSYRYVWAIDACTNAGYDFADLFTPDGEWSLSEAFGVPGTRAKTKGR